MKQLGCKNYRSFFLTLSNWIPFVASPRRSSRKSDRSRYHCLLVFSVIRNECSVTDLLREEIRDSHKIRERMVFLRNDHGKQNGSTYAYNRSTALRCIRTCYPGSGGWRRELGRQANWLRYITHSRGYSPGLSPLP